MTAHLSASEIASYRSRRQTPAELLRNDAHLQVCAPCREAVLGAIPLPASLRGVREALTRPEEPHPPYEELERVAEGSGSVGTEWATHFEECSSCRDLVRDLRELRFVGSRDEGQRVPAPSSRPRSFIRRQVLAAAAVIAIALLGLQLFMTRRGGNAFTPADRSLVEIRDTRSSIKLMASGGIEGLEAAAPSVSGQVRAALTGRVALPSDLELVHPPTGLLRSTNQQKDPIQLLSPVAIFIETDRPVFSWRAPGSATCRVEIYDAHSDLVARSGDLRADRWQSDRQLQRDQIYTWQIVYADGDRRGVVPSPPVAEARFKIVSAAEHDELDALRRSSASHLVMLVAYADRGLTDDALNEAARLRALNAGNAGALQAIDRISRQLGGR